MFAEYDVHFIAVNDGVDSEREDNDFTPIRNLFNEFYAKDTSKKLRAVWKLKGSSGERLAAVPVYGYKKDPDNPRKSVIDEEAAPIVKRIYQMCISGIGPSQIATQLSKEKILVPSYHLNNIGMNRRTDLGKNPYGWNCSTIAAILDRQDYLGHTTNFKYTRKSYKNHKTVFRPEEERLIFQNTHEAIITEEEWEAVQKIRQSRRRKNHTGEVNKFSGLLYCADCGSKMYFHSKPKKNNCFFQCSKYSYPPTSDECSTHFIREVVVEKIVLDDLNRLIAAANTDPSRLAEILSKKHSEMSRSKLASRKKQLANAQKRFDELDGLFKKIYEDNASGKLSNVRYEKLANGYETEQAELKEKISELTGLLNDQREEENNVKRFLVLVTNCTPFSELNTEILNTFISKIVIHAPDRSSGRRTLKVDIYYNFIGNVDTQKISA